jgi:hypothetical protein
MSVRRFQIETLENATCRVEQDDIRLWPMHFLGIERYQLVADPHRFQGSAASLAASYAVG